MTEEMRIKIGQRLVVGFDGLEVPPEYVELVKKYKVGNALLFMPFYALGNNCKEWLERLEFKTPSRTVLLLLMAAARASP